MPYLYKVLPELFPMYRILLALLTSVLLSAKAYAVETPKVVHGKLDLSTFDFTHNTVLALNGDWEFYWQRFVPYSELMAMSDSAKSYLRSDILWSDQELNRNKLPYYGYGTYYVQIQLPAAKKWYGIKIPIMSSASECWIDGKLISKVGEISDGKQSELPGFRPHVAAFYAEHKTIDLVFYVSNFSIPNEGGMFDAPQIGLAEPMQADWMKWVIISFFLMGSIFIMALYHFGLFLLRPQDLSTLIFGLFALFIAIRIPYNGQYYANEILPLPWQLMRKIDYGGFYLAVPAMLGLIRYLFPKEYSAKLFWPMIVFSVPFGIAVLSLPYEYYTYTLSTYQLFTLFSGIVSTTVLVLAAIRRRDGALVFVIGFMALFLTVINDILYVAHVIHTGHFVHFGLFTFIFAQAFLLSQRFSDAFKRAEKLAVELHAANQNLEEKVEARTLSLQKANTELARLSVIADKTDNAVLLIADDGTVEWINLGFTKMLGYTMDDLQQRFEANIFRMSRNDELRDWFDDALNEDTSRIVEQLYMSKSGERKWVQITLTPITLEHHDSKQVIAIASDIGLLKSAEAEIQQQKFEIEAQRDEVMTQRDRIADQNKRITDSLQYARSIQTATLPSELYFHTLFEESCVISMPKDIVSGDFYWVAKRDNEIVVTVADCTGHGVPGAFMSTLGVTLLNQVVMIERKQNAGEVLTSLRDKLKAALRQTETGSSSRDGMDMALCIIRPHEMTIDFAGARNPLWLINNDSFEMLKGDRMPVGIYPKEKESFTNYSVSYTPGTCLYLFSDGWVDQFYHDTIQKFGYQRLRDMVQTVHSESMREQERYFRRVFADWRGNYRQLDDVTLLGIKL